MPMLLAEELPQIFRHKAAIGRAHVSRPVQLALAYGILAPEYSFFDYGCGRGEDGRHLRAHGYEVAEWDPYYFPHNPHVESDVVNLGYVLNVIEDKKERLEALRGAWGLARYCLIIATRVSLGSVNDHVLEFSDGIVTKRNTFQKVFSQSELRTYIETNLGVSANPLSIGVFAVFKDKEREQAFRFRRYQPRCMQSSIVSPSDLYQHHKEALDLLFEFFVEHGRWPLLEENGLFSDVITAVGSLRRAKTILVQAVGQEPFDKLLRAKRETLLVYLCGEALSGRAKFSELPLVVKKDISNHFRNYKNACNEADQLLYSLAKPNVLNEAMKRAPIGKRVVNI